MKRPVSVICMIVCTFVMMQSHAQSIGSGLNCYLSNKENTKSQKDVFNNRFCIYKSNGKEYISLIMKVDKENNLNFLKKYDCIVGSRSGRIVTVRVNTKEISKFIKEKDIIDIETARKAGGIELKDAVKDLNMEDVWAGNDLIKAYTGKDVLIGVADWGIDYTHPTFFDSTMTEYRILAAWDQFREQGPAPEGFDYGTLLTGKQMLFDAGSDTSNIYDYGYHATHVGGIASGSGAGTKYKGLAYDANLIFCSWRIDEASYLDCCAWMRDFAKQANKRLVINNSWGVYIFGYMDGTSMLDEFINTMSEEENIVFVVSAGNNGSADFHLKCDFSSDKKGDTLKSEVDFNFPPFIANYWGQYLTLQSENNQHFSSKLEFYDYNWVKKSETPLMKSDGSTVTETTLDMENGNEIIYRGSSRYPQDGRPLVDWEVRQTKYHENTDHVVLVVTADDGIVHAWNLVGLSKAVGNTGFNFIDSQQGFIKGDDQYGVSEPGLAEKVITVAAHRFKKNVWTPIIATFSSRGPNMTDYLKPEISAPGYAIVSSVSSFSTNDVSSNVSVNFNDKDYYFNSASGTSMSAPMVTGAVALILQANPNLTSAEIKEIIKQSANTDEYTGQCPNDTWGYGKLNVYKAIQLAEKKLGIATTDDNSLTIFPVPATNYLWIEGAESNSEISVSDINGKTVLSSVLKNENIDITGLDSGIYVLKVKQKNGIKTLKFIKK